MEKIESKLHYYNPIARSKNQKPQLCYATWAEIVADRHGIEHEKRFGLDDIAYDSGVHIDKRDKNMFGGKLRERTVNHKDPRLGFQLKNLDDKSVRENLRKIMGGMEIKIIRPSEVGERNMKECMIDCIKKGEDVVINMRYEPFSGRKDGHYVVLAALEENLSNGSADIYVVDPSPYTPDYWKDDLSKFIYSMRPKWDGQERGIIVFSGPVHRKEDKPKIIENKLKEAPRYKPSIIRLRREKPHPIRVPSYFRQRFF
ncbi:MAG: hypothetical protein AABW50_03905 [Nanoarchaeota archaeon]